jgi:hypothetical protein
MKRVVRLAIALPSVTIAAFLIIMVANSISTQKRAGEVIDDLKNMSQAREPTKKFEALRQKYGSKIKRSETCTPEHCFYEIGINNRLFAILHLADFAEMTTAFQFDRGSLSFTITDYRLALRDGVSPVVHVQEICCEGKCVDWLELGANPHGQRSTNVSNGMVEFNRNATKEERDAALSFNLRCLSPFTTCKDIADLLPGMWVHNAYGSVRCRFRTSGDAYDDWK